MLMAGYRHITSLLNFVTAKKRPALDAQKARAIYKKRYKYLNKEV
jgi:hypothetical protein